MKVLKLTRKHSNDVKRLMLAEHPAGAAILLEQLIDDYFLAETIGCAIGAYVEQQLCSLMLTSFDDNAAVTRGIYGQLGKQTKQMLDLLDLEIKARPNVDSVGFVLLEQNALMFKKQLLQSTLGKRIVCEEISLPFGKIPADKELWLSVLSKNIPYANLSCIKARI